MYQFIFVLAKQLKYFQTIFYCIIYYEKTLITGNGKARYNVKGYNF